MRALALLLTVALLAGATALSATARRVAPGPTTSLKKANGPHKNARLRGHLTPLRPRYFVLQVTLDDGFYDDSIDDSDDGVDSIDVCPALPLPRFPKPKRYLSSQPPHPDARALSGLFRPPRLARSLS